MFFFRGTDEGDLKKAVEVGMFSLENVNEVEEVVQPIFEQFHEEGLDGAANSVKERLARVREWLQKTVK